MTSITTNVKHRVRTTGSELQGWNSISDREQNLGFTCIFSSGVQETCILIRAGGGLHYIEEQRNYAYFMMIKKEYYLVLICIFLII